MPTSIKEDCRKAQKNWKVPYGPSNYLLLSYLLMFGIYLETMTSVTAKTKLSDKSYKHTKEVAKAPTKATTSKCTAAMEHDS